MTTALDILIRARDEASAAVKRVGGAVTETTARADRGAAGMTRFGNATHSAGMRVGTAIKGIGAAAGFVAVDELAKKSLEAFDQLEVGERRLNYGLKKIGENKDDLEGLVGWAKDFSKQTGVAEADVVGMESKLTTMGGNFLKTLGPQANGTLKKITSGMVNLGSATGKSASLLLRSLGPSLMNSPGAAIAQLKKYGVLTTNQGVKLKALTTTTKLTAAQQAKMTQAQINAFYKQAALTDATRAHQASMIEINALYQKYNGVAAASETPMEKLKNGINQIELSIGALINRGLAWLINVGFPAMHRGIDAVITKARPFLVMFGHAAVGVLKAYRDAWVRLLPALRDFWRSIQPVAKILAIVVGIIVLGLLKALPTLIRILTTAIIIWIKISTTLNKIVVGAIRAVIGAFVSVYNAGKRVTGWFHRAWNATASLTERVAGRISSALGSLFGPLISAAEHAINLVKTVIGWIKKIPTHIPGIGGGGSSGGGLLSHIPGVGGIIEHTPLGHIPGLASGGIVHRATLAVIGEAGPEAVIPLKHAHKYLSGDGGRTLYVEINNPVPEKASESVPKRLRELDYVTGYRW